METNKMETGSGDNETSAKCTVRERKITLDQIKALLKEQRNMVTTNYREEGQSAFKKTLNGSKEYLKHNGLIK